MSLYQRIGDLAWIYEKLKEVKDTAEIALNASDPNKRDQA